MSIFLRAQLGADSELPETEPFAIYHSIRTGTLANAFSRKTAMMCHRTFEGLLFEGLVFEGLRFDAACLPFRTAAGVTKIGLMRKGVVEEVTWVGESITSTEVHALLAAFHPCSDESGSAGMLRGTTELRVYLGTRGQTWCSGWLCIPR